MPRTATTFFQTFVFPNLPGIDYYGLPFTQINPAFNAAMYADDTEFDEGAFKSQIDSLTGNRVLMSNENFAGQSLYWHFGNRTRIAKRFHAAMPNATIILFLRNQPDLIRSLYLIALQANETKSLSEFLRKPKPAYNETTYRASPKVDLYDFAPYDTYHSCEQLTGYDYAPLIDLYRSLFPKVEIFLFEDFLTSPVETYHRLGNVFGLKLPEDVVNAWQSQSPVNAATGKLQANWLRRLNKWDAVLQSNRFGRSVNARLKRFIINHLPEGGRLNWSDSDAQYLRTFFAQRNLDLNSRFPEIGLGRHKSAYMID